MKINISRQYIFLLLLATVLLIFILLFSFAVLIPKGKEYRIQRNDLRKVQRDVKRHEDFNNQTYEILKKLQSQNRHVISSLDAAFNPERFKKQHKNYFNSLSLSKMTQSSDEDGFAVYEVNTTSKINSPKVFYNFLDAVNKGDWMVQVNFPINFKREVDMIQSSFTMKVYSNQDDSNDSNTTKVEVKEKAL